MLAQRARKGAEESAVTSSLDIAKLVSVPECASAIDDKAADSAVGMSGEAVEDCSVSTGTVWSPVRSN